MLPISKSRRRWPSGLFLAVFLLAARLTNAAADQIHIDWPANAAGNYFLPSLGIMEGPDNKSKTFEVPEGKNIRLVGTGFDVNFILENGKFRFPQRLPEDSVGIRLDAKTHTFSFVTVPVTIQVKNCDLDILLNGTKPHQTLDEARGWTETYNLVYGGHTLRYGGTRLPFTVDSRGSIALQQDVAGIRALAGTISVEGKPVVLKPEDPNARWTLLRTGLRQKTGEFTAFLLPGQYSVQGKSRVDFAVDSAGLIGPASGEWFAELVAFPGAIKVTIPNGEALFQARLQKAKQDKEVRDRLWTASSRAAWKADFDLREKMDIYDFPEEQLSYEVDFPGGVAMDRLRLLGFTDSTVRLMEFQLANTQKVNGGTRATLRFRTDLPRRSHRTFRLVADLDFAEVQHTDIHALTDERTNNPGESILSSGLLSVRFPEGKSAFPGGRPLSQVPPPVLSLARTGEKEMAKGSFAAPAGLKVLRMEGREVESGPVVRAIEVAYEFEGQKSYTARIELRANEPQIHLAEFYQGFNSQDATAFRLDYGPGLLDPDRRWTGSNAGYELYSGDYDRGLEAGELNFNLGLFTPNGLGVMRSTLFYRDAGTDALMVTMDRMEDWKTEKRALWSSRRANENIRFFSEDGAKYLTSGMSGRQKFWVVGVIPRGEVVLKTLPFGREGADGVGPEARLFNQLGLWSLDAYKNRIADWPEKLDAAPFDTVEKIDYPRGKPWEKRTYEEYVDKYLNSNIWFRDVLNHSSNFGGHSDRALPAFFAEYALSRASWTPEQRDRIRTILLTFADYADSDLNQPHHSMLSGHPNFVMDTKQAIPFAVATFSTHPRAKLWRDSYMAFYNEWLDRYSRPDNPDLHTKGGRWTENIACYVGQCFAGVLPDQILLRWYDGTSLAKNPRLPLLMSWMRDAFMSPHDGKRMVPPQGAHSHAFNPGSPFWNIFFQLGEEIAPDQPQLSAELKWIETDGKQGTKPDIRSALFTDYGPVLHSDFSGPHEAYAHMQNLTGLNYRWTGAGILYYGARGKIWSYNNTETNGDEFDWNVLSAFNIRGKGLSAGPTDQLLYDFGFVQFYRQPSAEEDNSYRARAIMLARDDYLVVSDEVSNPKATGTFNWVNLYDLPQIYQLKPGAPKVEKIGRDPQPPRPDALDRIGHVLSYTGFGDFLTVVAPVPVEAAAKPFGATVNGEYVFANQIPQDVRDGPALFSGTYGYARSNQLALFQGTSITLNGFTLRRAGGDFGASAEIAGKTITGHFVGREGGQLFITPPAGFKLDSIKLQVEGKDMPVTLANGTLSFPVKVTQEDGLRSYAITFG